MAVWALDEFGIRCIIAQSYGDIFFSNCLQNGLLPIVLERAELNRLAIAAASGATITVDLPACSIMAAGLGRIPFALPQAHRRALLSGAADTHLTLAMTSEIDRFQSDRNRAA